MISERIEAGPAGAAGAGAGIPCRERALVGVIPYLAAQAGNDPANTAEWE